MSATLTVYALPVFSRLTDSQISQKPGISSLIAHISQKPLRREIEYRKVLREALWVTLYQHILWVYFVLYNSCNRTGTNRTSLQCLMQLKVYFVEQKTSQIM